MKLLATASIISLLALTGCDDGGIDPTDDVQTFRAEGGSSTFTPVLTTQRPIKIKGCDPIWWLVGDEELVSFEDAYDEWQARIRVQANHTADVGLESLGAGGMCAATCEEAGGKWIGEVSVEESWHEVGETEVVGECPFGTLATETEVLAMGAVACTCAG